MIAESAGSLPDGIDIYRQQIETISLLDRAAGEETDLIKRIHAGREAIKLARQAEDARQTEETLQAVIAEGQSARTRLVESNLRLVVSIARKYHQTSGLQIEDHIQAGNEGLMHAVDHVEPRYGYWFATYATNCIRGYILRSLNNNSSTVHIPQNAWAKLSLLEQARYERSGDFDRPSDQEISDSLDFSSEDFETAKMAERAKDIVGLYVLTEAELEEDEISAAEWQKIDPPQAETLAEDIEDRNIEPIEDLVVDKDMIDTLWAETKEKLEPKEIMIIDWLYGFTENRRTMTETEIARQRYTSKQTVNKFKHRALKKIQIAIGQ